jgi:drug/metabolite transporter (DMT)-like permease
MLKNPLPKNISDAHLKIEIAFLIANVIWGAATPVIKFTLDYIPPFTFLYLRFLLVCLLILPWIAHQLRSEPISKSDYLNFFFLGLFSQPSLIIPFVALKFTSALDFTIIGVIGTVLAVYAGHYFYKEKINKGIVVGLVLASLGTVFIVLEPILSGHNNGNSVFERTMGNVLGLFYAIVWVIYVIWSKYSMGETSKMLKKTLSFIHLRPMTKRYSPTTIVLCSFFVGLFTLIPLAIIENIKINSMGNFNLFAIDYRGVLGLLYMAIYSSIVAYHLNQWGLRYVKVSNFAIYGYLAPVFTLPFAFLLLGEFPNTFMFAGAALITIGVVVAERANSISC